MKLQNPGAFVNSDIATSDDYGCGSNHMVFDVPLDLCYATFSLSRVKLKKWDGKFTGKPNESGMYYGVDERTLPPGVNPREIVTLAHTRDGMAIGGISYRMSDTQTG